MSQASKFHGETESIEELKEKLALQKDEINNLKLQLENSIRSKMFHKDLLEDVERNHSEINRTLQDQLDKALKKKADLQIDELPNDFTLDGLDESNSSKAVNDLVKANALINKLKFELEMERGHINILKNDNKLLRKMAVELHASAEQEEEFISNRLLKRISGLKKEKGDLLQMVEQEEEYLTNSLQKRIIQLQKEKVDLENALEQEQEYVVNKLQKQLDNLRMQYASHSPSPTILPSQRESITNSPPLLPTAIISSSPPTGGAWRPTHSPSTSDYGGTSPGVVEMLKAEVTSLRLKLAEMEREVISAHNQTRRFRNEINELRKAYDIPIPDDSYASENTVRSRRSISNASSNAPPTSLSSESRRHSGRSLSLHENINISISKEEAEKLGLNPKA